MKKLLIILILLQSTLFSDTTESILKEIKQLRIDMNKRFEQIDKRLDMMQHYMDKRFEQVDKRFEQIDKRFEQVDKRFEQVDKRFEQVDKRFEQVDKRFDTVFNLLFILMGLVFASPFVAIYLRDKKEAEYRKNFEIIKGILFALRDLAQNDEKLAKSLRAANLL